MREVYIPKTEQIFWCQDCGYRSVASFKPETGRFFVQYGHSYSNATNEYDGKYAGVMFALCPNCLPKFQRN